MKLAVSEKGVRECGSWFAGYVGTFLYGDVQSRRNVDLKKEHTLRVCREILSLGEQLGLGDDEMRLAEVIALLHDIGRFEQYDRYRTFLDRESENHAELGVRVLQEHGVLDGFDGAVRDILLRSIRYHNRRSLPRDETEACLFFSRLLRDADKLDIWKVVTEYYHGKGGERNEALELNLPDTQGVSREVYRDVMKRELVDMRHVRNLNDFKLLQAGWVFDINFRPTLDCMKNRRYLELLRDVLPESREVKEMFGVFHEALDRMGRLIPAFSGSVTV
jgi:putative nucleotidyltransferase with HDIG domain